MKAGKRLVARGIVGIVCVFLVAGLDCPFLPPEESKEPGSPIPPVINNPPVATAVADPTAVSPGDIVSLDASGSSDPDGDALSFLWEPTSDTPALTITDPESAMASFAAPLVSTDTVVTLRVSVSDGIDTSTALVDVTLLASNRGPLAAAFADPEEAPARSKVTLDARGSSDPDGDGLTYSWQQTDGIRRINLADADTAVATFVAPQIPAKMVLTFEVTVSDGELNATAEVLVTILPFYNSGGGGGPGGGPGGDVTPPNVTIDQAVGQADPAPAGLPINFTAVFNEPVLGFADGDVTLAGTAGATTATVTQIAPNDGTTYNVAVTGMIADGTVIATIGAGVATDAAGNPNTASTSVDNIVTYDATAPGLMAAASRKTHGLVDFDRAIVLATGPDGASTEMRAGGPTRMILTLSEPVAALDGSLDADAEVTTDVNGVPTAGLITGVALNLAGDVMTVDLAGVPDCCLRIALVGIGDLAGNPLAGDNDVHVRVLLGDVNASGLVDNADIIQVRLNRGVAVDPTTYRCDVNCNGVIDNADMIQVRLRRGNTVVCP